MRSTMTIAQRLYKARESFGLKQDEMAQKLGASTGAYSTYERGKRSPQLEHLAASATLGFSIDWLVTGDGQMRREGGDGGILSEVGVRRVIEAVMAEFPGEVRDLLPEKIADLVVLACHDLKESGENEVDTEKLRRYIKLAS